MLRKLRLGRVDSDAHHRRVVPDGQQKRQHHQLLLVMNPSPVDRRPVTGVVLEEHTRYAVCESAVIVARHIAGDAHGRVGSRANRDRRRRQRDDHRRDLLDRSERGQWPRNLWGSPGSVE